MWTGYSSLPTSNQSDSAIIARHASPRVQQCSGQAIDFKPSVICRWLSLETKNSSGDFCVAVAAKHALTDDVANRFLLSPHLKMTRDQRTLNLRVHSKV